MRTQGMCAVCRRKQLLRGEYRGISVTIKRLSRIRHFDVRNLVKHATNFNRVLVLSFKLCGVDTRSSVRE